MRFILTFFLVVTTLTFYSQNIKIIPVVDERVELLSIVFRLAEIEEYSMTNIKNYSNAIDTYFSKYKDDELIKFIKTIRKKNEVAYDAVMSMALNIDLDNSSIILKKNVDNTSLDSRWGTFTDQFLLFLNDFYKKSDFHKFFLNNKQLYSITENRFLEVINTVDLNWFEKFYGERPKGKFHLIISLASGGGAYGEKIKYLNGITDIYSIIGAWDTDSLGYPTFKTSYTNGIVHEFNHSFCNYLVDNHYSEMKNNAIQFFKLVKSDMQRQAYGEPIIMIYETMVRAATIVYFKDHQKSEIELIKLASGEQSNGFIWIKPLIKSLENYQNSRDKYPTLTSYMPQIVTLHNSLNPKQTLKECDCIGPEIINFSIKNNSVDIDPNTKELILTFDRPMNGSYGMWYGRGGKKRYPKIKSINWDKEKLNELKIAFELESNKKYSIKFTDNLITDYNGCKMKKSYFLNFSTK